MENGFVDVTSIEEQQDEADFEQNTSNKDGSADPPAVPALTRVVEIERIVDERGRGAKKSGEQHEYLVKWKSVKQCWLSAADLKKFPQLTEAFEKRKGQKSTARDEDVARDGAEHHDETDDNDANQYTDHDYTGTQQVPSKHPLQNGGIAKSDDLIRSSSRQHRPTKRFVEETNEAVERGKKARRTSPRKSGKKAGKSVLEEENDEEEQDEEYAVEKVLKKRERGSRVQYRVKWAGYDSSYNSWEPRNSLKHLDIVKQFEQEQSALEQKTDDNLEEDKKEKKNEEGGEEEQDGEEEEEEEEDDDGKEYKVERILEKRVGDDGELEYLVKWQQYSNKWNSWEPVDGLKHLEVVKRFEEKEQSALEPKSDKLVSSNRSSRASSRATVSTPVSLKGTTSSTIVMNKRVRVVIRKEEPVAGPSTGGVGKAEAADAEPKTVGKKRKKRARY